MFEPFGGLIDVVIKHSMQEQVPNSNQVHKQHGYAFFLMENSQSAGHLLQSLQSVHNNNIENVRYDGKITNTLHKNAQHQAGQASSKDRHILYQNHPSSTSAKQVVPSNKDSWMYPAVPSAVAVAEKHRTMLAMMQQAGASTSAPSVTYTLTQAPLQLHGPPSLLPTGATVVTPSSSPEVSSTPSTSTTSSMSTHSSGSAPQYAVHAFAHPQAHAHAHGQAHTHHHHHHGPQAAHHVQPALHSHVQPVVHSSHPPLLAQQVVGQQFLSTSPSEMRGVPVLMVANQSPRSPSQSAQAFGPPSPPHLVNGQPHSGPFAHPQFPASAFFPPMPMAMPMMPSPSGGPAGSAHMMVSPFPPMAYANVNPQPTMMMVQSSGSSPPSAQPVITPVFAYHHQQQPAAQQQAPQPPGHHQYQLHHVPHHPHHQQHHLQMPSPHGYAPAMH